MLRKSAPLAALALVLALAVGLTGTAAAQEPRVELRGKVKPQKLPKEKFRNVNLFSSVGHDNADGSSGVPKPTRALRIDFGKNVRFRPNKPRRCTADLDGTTTQQARNRCPRKSIIGRGTAHVRLPGPTDITDLTTLAIAGPGKNRLRFHAYSPTLGPAVTQVILGIIRRSAPGGRYAWRLNVPQVPEILGGAGANTLFGVRIRKGSKVTQARCRAKRFLWRAQWIFNDDTSKRAFRKQRCRRR